MPLPLHQTPSLPWEITDTIIDYLRDDQVSLGACSSVCSEWSMRTRYHTFSTIQLWPWRVAKFFELAQAKHCTFTSHVERLEFDDCAWRNSKKPESTPPSMTALEGHTRFNDALAHESLPSLSRLRSLHIRNVNWTTFSPPQQTILRHRLAKLSELRRLELANVTFHDLREVVRIVESMSKLDQLGLDVVFMKYLEHTLASAARLRLPPRLTTIELGSNDTIPVVLTCVNSDERPLAYMRVLRLQNVKLDHLDYMRLMLQASGTQLQHIDLRFGFDGLGTQDHDSQSLAGAINFSQLGQLRTLRIAGLNFACASGQGIEKSLPSILSTIESSFLEWVELRFAVDRIEDVGKLDWAQLERVLLAHHFFGLVSVRVVVELGRDVERDPCLASVREALPLLDERNVLTVSTLDTSLLKENGCLEGFIPKI